MNRKELRKILKEEREQERTVYILEVNICNKFYYKVGCTTNIITRINSIKRELKKLVQDDFNIKIIIQFNFKNSSMKEAEILNEIETLAIETGYSFGGNTETFKHEIKVVHTFLKHIETELYS